MADPADAVTDFPGLYASLDMYLQSVSEDLKTAFFSRMTGPQDYRMLKPQEPAWEISVDELLPAFAAAAVPPVNPLKFIFMTDYCCSSLLFHLLAELNGCFALGESLLFASLALAKRALDFGRPVEFDLEKWQRVLDLALCLTSRSYAPPQTVVVKEWPLASYIIGDLLKSGHRASAVFLYSDLRTYLAGVLKKERRRSKMRTRVQEVFTERQRYPALRDFDVRELQDPQLAVLHWLLQFHNVSAAARGLPSGAIRALNCQRLLETPQATLAAVARQLGLSPDEDELRKVIASPVFTTYAKEDDPALAGAVYGMEARDRDLENTRRLFGEEIEIGIRWAERWFPKDLFENLLPAPLDVDV